MHGIYFNIPFPICNTYSKFPFKKGKNCNARNKFVVAMPTLKANSVRKQHSGKVGEFDTTHPAMVTHPHSTAWKPCEKKSRL